MRNTIISSIRQGIRNAIESVVSALAPIFYWPGTHTLEATTGTDPTFTRATAATFEDFEGLIKTVESQEPRFQGARRVENLTTLAANGSSENFVGWTTYAGRSPVVTLDTVDFPQGTMMSTQIVSTGGYEGREINPIFEIGRTYTVSCWVKGNVGGELFWINDGSNTAGALVATAEWKRYFQTFTTPTPEMAFGNVQAGKTIKYAGMQIEDVTGQTNQNPSEYVSTGVGTGPELIPNQFGVGWAIDAGATVVGETLVVGSGSGANLAYYGSSALFGIPQTVQVTYTISDYVSGSVTCNVGQSSLSASNSANGTFTETVSPNGSYPYITFSNTSNFIGSISNVSVKRAEHGANVDGVEYFNTLNANTVTANVVTEVVGSELTRANTQFGELMAAGDYFSTPNVVTTWPELDIRVRVQIDSFPNGYALLFDKRNSFYLSATPSGSTQRVYLVVYDATGGSSVFNSSDFPTSVLGVRNWYRVTYDATTGDAKFFTADGNLESPAVSDYVQLSTLTYAPRAISVNTNSFLAGTWGSGLTTYPFDGDIYRSQVFNEIDGTTPVVDFTAGSYVSGSTLVSSTSGETWTLEGNASIFQPPVDASGPFGYLAEKASTNLALQSEDFTTSWTAQGATVTANAAVAPDGTTTMDRLVVDTANNFHDVYQLKTVVASTNYTHSVYMKDDGAGFGGINFGVGNDYISVVADLSTGLVTDTDVGSTSGTIVATGCEDAGNGVYRVWISGSIGATAGYMIPFLSDVAVPSAWSGGRPQYTGVLGEDILVWGAQLEAGTYPTSYIPTTTTDVLRNADVLIAGDMVTDAAGSAYTEVSSIKTSSAHTYVLALAGNRYLIYSNTNGNVNTSDGVNTSASPVGSSFYTAPRGVASTWGNALTAYADGSPDLTPAAYDGTMGGGVLAIGSNQGVGDIWDGTIREVKIFDSELTAAEVGDL